MASLADMLNAYLDLRRGWIACVIVAGLWIEAPRAFATWWEADAASLALLLTTPIA